MRSLQYSPIPLVLLPFIGSILWESTWDYQHLFGPWAKRCSHQKFFPRYRRHGQWHKRIHSTALKSIVDYRAWTAKSRDGIQRFYMILFMDSISKSHSQVDPSRCIFRPMYISHTHTHTTPWYCVSSVRCEYCAHFTHSVFSFVCFHFICIKFS